MRTWHDKIVVDGTILLFLWAHAMMPELKIRGAAMSPDLKTYLKKTTKRSNVLQ